MQFFHLLISLSILIGITGCIEGENKKRFLQEESPTSLYSRVFASEKADSKIKYSSQPIFLKAILNTPVVSQKLAAINIAKNQIIINEKSRNTSVTAIGSSGIRSEYQGQAEATVATTLKAQKPLTDFGHHRFNREIAYIDLQLAKATAYKEIDFQLSKLFSLMETKFANEKKLDSLEISLKAYQRNADLVKKALTAGVINKSKFLQLEGIKNNLLLKKIEIDRELSKTQVILREYFKTDKIIVPKLNKKLEKFSRLSAYPKKKYGKLLEFELKDRRFQEEIKKKRSVRRPTTNLEAAISTPVNKERDFNIFAGITLNFPILDGGRSLEEVDLIENRKLENFYLKKKFLNDIEILQKEVRNSYQYYTKKRKLLLESLEISKAKIEEFELLFEGTRLDPSEQAKEIFSASNFQLELITLNESHNKLVLDAHKLTTNTCELLSVCEEITFYLDNTKYFD